VKSRDFPGPPNLISSKLALLRLPWKKKDEIGHAGDVAVGSAKTGHQSNCDRVFADDEDDRNRACRRFSGQGAGQSLCYDDFRFTADQIGMDAAALALLDGRPVTLAGTRALPRRRELGSQTGIFIERRRRAAIQGQEVLDGPAIVATR
jgi:hypothetical protein